MSSLVDQIEVKYSQHPLFVAYLKVIVAILILAISLIIYLIGILLSITIIGAILGIPIILFTYAIDTFALYIILNPREKIIRLVCPRCRKGKLILPLLMTKFRCNRCSTEINIILS